MFPHTVTIFHHSVLDGKDVYSRTTIKGCYWCRKASLTGAGKGTEKTDSYTIIFSPEQTAQYGTEWNVCTGDRVVKGVVGMSSNIAGIYVVNDQFMTSWKDLKGDVMVVKAIEENICGSSVDNITLIG